MYTIGAFSALTGLGIHTLRYYEKEHLLSPARAENGRRIYTEQDVLWLQFVLRLKDTGMPIKEIRRYAVLRSSGDDTLAERYAMLTAHRGELERAIDTLQEHLRCLDQKIDVYRHVIASKPE